jgi:hypothetical protein
MYMPSFMKIRSGIQKLIGIHALTQAAWRSQKPIIFQNKECRLTKNKKLWEVLLVYFPLIRHNSQRQHLKQFFVTAGTSLPSCYLAMIGGYTDKRAQQYFYCGMYRGNVFAEPLPSNERRDTIYRACA